MDQLEAAACPEHIEQIHQPAPGLPRVHREGPDPGLGLLLPLGLTIGHGLLGGAAGVVHVELVAGVEHQRQQLQEREPVLGNLGAHEAHKTLTVLQNTFMNVESPGRYSFVRHNLLEADRETFSEESLAMLTLCVKFPFTELYTVLE